ncbi:group III truncated hemoglobin [Chitinimonas naiadis]
MRDIAREIGLEQVRLVVDTFYRRVRAHPLLSVPFARVHDWPQHLEHLSHFWWVTLGGERYLDYRYAVPQRHAEAGFTPALLVDWLALFHETVREQVAPPLADAWLERAERIGKSLSLMHELGHFPPPPTLPVTTVPQ